MHSGVYALHRATTDAAGAPSWRLAGRFMIGNGHVSILEDYYGLLEDVIGTGMITPELARRLNSLSRSSYLRVEASEPEEAEPVPAPAANGGVAPTATPVIKLKLAPVARPPVFEYVRAGMDAPHIIEFRQGKALIDGNPMTEADQALILENVGTGAATIRYRGSRTERSIRKMEDFFRTLLKQEGDMDPASALASVREAVKAGHMHPDVERALTRHVYEDKMTPGIGNKYAYSRFKAQPKAGVHISMDGNDFKAINDIHGHEAGDAAIGAFGRAAREAMDEAVGNDKGKLFRNPDEQDLYRNGGDEFTAHVPTHEHAAKFARLLREKLEQVPPIGGTHKLSMSFGFGTDPLEADTALYEAKKQKWAPGAERRWAPGQVPSLAHSLVPGSEGPIPLQPETMPMSLPKPEAPKAEVQKPASVHAPTAS